MFSVQSNYNLTRQSFEHVLLVLTLLHIRLSVASFDRRHTKHRSRSITNCTLRHSFTCSRLLRVTNNSVTRSCRLHLRTPKRRQGKDLSWTQSDSSFSWPFLPKLAHHFFFFRWRSLSVVLQFDLEAMKLWYETLHEAETAGASHASKPSNILLHLATDKQNQASWEGGQQNG